MIQIQRRLWQEVCELLLLGVLKASISHSMACISFEQDGMVPKLCYNCSLNFVIFGNPLAEIKGYLSNLGEWVLKN